MSNLYRYQSDPNILINLETPDQELLRERQRALQEMIAKMSMDLVIISGVLNDEEARKNRIS